MSSLLLGQTMFLRRRDWVWNERPFISTMLTGSITLQQSSTCTIKVPVEPFSLSLRAFSALTCHAVSLTWKGSGPCLRGCLTHSALSWSVLMEEAGRMSPGHARTRWKGALRCRCLCLSPDLFPWTLWWQWANTPTSSPALAQLRLLERGGHRVNAGRDRGDPEKFLRWNWSLSGRDRHLQWGKREL